MISMVISFCVKYRRKVLTDEISARLYEILDLVAAEKGFSIIECKVGENDHVHCLNRAELDYVCAA